MTYFGFLFRFLVVPILILLGVAFYDHRRGKQAPLSLRNWPAWAAIGLHAIIAFIYTTPWDNYLVATNVWWYDINLVSGIVWGWVPIEEYTFFVLQPILGGLWILLLARYLPVQNPLPPLRPWLRPLSLLLILLVWLSAALILVTGWRPGTYLALELTWALLPIALQLGFGADILWRYRRLVVWTIIPLTLYLSAADALAIESGTWTIDPQQSLNFLLGGILPVEEFLFFLLTNMLISFGVVLVIARDSQERLRQIKGWVNRRASVLRMQPYSIEKDDSVGQRAEAHRNV